VNILFTSVGRRVALIKAFQQSMKQLHIQGRIVTTDLKKNAPASFIADIAEIVPRVDDPNYIDSLTRICTQYQIELLIPLIDTELHLLAFHQQEFAKIGVRLLISSPNTNEICFDKNNTAKFFDRIGVKTPKIYKAEQYHTLTYPAILKPANGSCSVGLHKLNSKQELEFFSKYINDAIIQELIIGEEYTIDVLTNLEGKVISAVPRLRLETRAGEISKGITVKNPSLISAAKHVVESLPGAIGCITVQCFLQTNGEIIFIEINPRFGGGYPLSYQAGADFPTWIIQLVKGKTPNIAIDEWQDGLVMLRYDDAIFVNKSDI
jgi:carbamoyl-phosphate synthase large subunit